MLSGAYNTKKGVPFSETGLDAVPGLKPLHHTATSTQAAVCSMQPNPPTPRRSKESHELQNCKEYLNAQKNTNQGLRMEVPITKTFRVKGPRS